MKQNTTIQFSNAKINLGLHITKRRSDGFHDLESIFLPVKCSDVIEIRESKQTNFYSYGRPIPGDSKENLCIKAYELLQKDFDIPPVEIHLLKNLPIGAGMGGGSSNASFTLKALNELFGLEISNEKLRGYAGQLGSDCPFFIENKPIYAKGTGDIFTEIDLSLSGYHFLLVYPNLHVNTGRAFQQMIPYQPLVALKETIQIPIEHWKDNVVNDFERPIFKAHPELAQIKAKMYEKGAIYASMSGSGSTVFGIFAQPISDLGTFGKNHWSYSFVMW